MTTAHDDLKVSIATPAEWLEVRPNQLDDAAVADFVSQRLEEIPQLAPYRDHLLETARQSLHHIESHGVIHTAVMADVTNTDKPMLANLAVAWIPGPPPSGKRHEPPGIEDIEAALADVEPGVDQRQVDSILLPAGPALRIARLMDLAIVRPEEDGSGGLSFAVLSVQYYFGVPDVDEFLILNFTTPTIGAHLKLQKLFHLIASSVRFVGGDGQEIRFGIRDPEPSDTNGDGGAPAA